MGIRVEQHVKEDEAKRLGQLLSESGISNLAAFARDCGLPGGKSMLSQHLAALRPISLECAVAYALGLGRPLVDISPRLAGIIGQLPDAQGARASGCCPPPAVAFPADLHPQAAVLIEAITRLTPADIAMLHLLVERLATLPERGEAKQVS